MTFVRGYFPQFDWQRLLTVSEILDAKHFGWFGAGAIFYQYFKTGSRLALCAAFVIGWTASAFQSGLTADGAAIPFIIVAVFGLSISIPAIQRLLATGPILFLGAVSYPLYLLHENLMLSLMVKLGRSVDVPDWALPILPVLVLATLALAVTKFVEPFGRRLLSKIFAPVALFLSTTKT